MADLSRLPTGEEPLWLASVRDAFSRGIVGWKTSDRADTQLVVGDHVRAPYPHWTPRTVDNPIGR